MLAKHLVCLLKCFDACSMLFSAPDVDDTERVRSHACELKMFVYAKDASTSVKRSISR